MKKIFNIILSGIVVFSASSCKKYLDINENPNKAISSTPELVLPQAMVSTGALLTNGVNYNFYGSGLVGYVANAGGVGGWGSFITYQYVTSDFQDLFQKTYDNLADYQYIIDQTAGKTDQYQLFNAAANAMRAYDFQLLVDTYNDVPYSDALKGTGQLLAKYDKGEDIYKDLGSKLDAALEVFKAKIEDHSDVPVVFTNADPMFHGDIEQWAKFINTLKLKLMVRASGKVQFAKTSLDAVGFLDADALVNPGYVKVAGKQNPFWDWFAYDAAGSAQGRGGQYVPTPFIMKYYDGGELSDPWRATALYQEFNGTSAPTNRLGYLGQDAETGGTPNAWFISDGTPSATNYYSVGVFKGPSAGQPIFLATESYFLQAEARMKGMITSGDVKSLFDAGIESSFDYLYQNETGGYSDGFDNPAGDAADYQAENSSKYLANIDLASNDEQRLEAIITQKYIALNFLFGHEAWNEFRRTGYPKITGNGPTQTFASIASVSTAGNKLPTRILYPGSEFTYNSNNVPKGINAFTSKIFWAK